MKKQVLILSGPTHEYIDPVRFIGNASSGKMGKALAEEALKRNYTVEIITGPVESQNLPNIGKNQIHKITSAKDMLVQALELFSRADIIIFAAAVADYSPKETKNKKMGKSKDELTLTLVPTPDIAQTLGEKKLSHQITLGFALQTHNGEQNAQRKLCTKKFDAIVLNDPRSLGASDGTFSCLTAQDNQFIHWGTLSKETCAKNIFDCLKTL